MKLAVQMLFSALGGIVFFAVALFVPAGTLNYWQAWVFIAVFTVATLVPTTYLAVKDPAALQRRVHAGPTAESRPVQRLITIGIAALTALMLVVSAFDHRFGWSSVPLAVVIAGQILVAVGLVGAQLVVRKNSYAAATITVESGQALVSTGVYGIVRHPMYSGALVMMLGTPLALDSYWGLLVLVPAVLVLAARIVDEEKLLTQDLDGYAEYKTKVRHRLVPLVW